VPAGRKAGVKKSPAKKAPGAVQKKAGPAPETVAKKGKPAKGAKKPAAAKKSRPKAK
jgi:hypothetical protein